MKTYTPRMRGIGLRSLDIDFEIGVVGEEEHLADAGLERYRELADELCASVLEESDCFRLFGDGREVHAGEQFPDVVGDGKNVGFLPSHGLSNRCGWSL